MNATRDKYDEAIDWLVEHAADDVASDICSSVVDRAWQNPQGEEGGCLFQFANPSGEYWEDVSDEVMCGCLSMIRLEKTMHAWTPELTAEIRADERLVSRVKDIENLRGDDLRAALQPFAEWQRRLDREIRQPTDAIGPGSE